MSILEIVGLSSILYIIVSSFYRYKNRYKLIERDKYIIRSILEIYPGISSFDLQIKLGWPLHRVYPALDHLERSGDITSWFEIGPLGARRPRRLYALSLDID